MVNAVFGQRPSRRDPMTEVVLAYANFMAAYGLILAAPGLAITRSAKFIIDEDWRIKGRIVL